MFTKREPARAIEDEEPNVIASMELLKIIVDDVNMILDKINIDERRSIASFYIGILLGTLIGVVGNFFVSFWFQKMTTWNLLGLIISGVLLLIVSATLSFQARKYGDAKQ